MPEAELPHGARPLAVTIIAWVSIGFGVLFALVYGLVAFVLVTAPGEENLQNPSVLLGWNLPAGVYWTLALAAPLVLLGSGAFMLKGHNWARLLAMTWYAFCLISLFYTYGLHLLTGIQIAVCLLIILQLSTGPAVEFFKTEGSKSESNDPF